MPRSAAPVTPTATSRATDRPHIRENECTMSWNWHLGRSPTLEETSTGRDRKRLRALIDQATSDSVDESDEHAGLLSTIREEVACPFPARLIGEDVECIR